MNTIQITIKENTQNAIVRLLKDQIAREEKDIKKWEDRLSYAKQEKAIEIVHFMVESHKKSIEELHEQIKEVQATKKHINYYDVEFTSKSWHSQFVCSWEGDISKDELSFMVEEKTGEKPILVIRKIYKEEYDLMIKEEYKTLDNL